MGLKPMFTVRRKATLQPAIFMPALNLISGLLLLFLAFSAQASNQLSQAAQTRVAQNRNADMNFRLDTLVEKPTIRSDSNSTADHTKFEDLKAAFSSGPEVTKACLKCHTEAGQQFMKNIHWTWSYENKKTVQQLGKKHLVNTFCTNSRGNEGMCAQCHAGYGWKDESFDFSNQNNVDCVVCHDRTGTYYKTPPTKGNKSCSVMFEGKQPIQWSKVAQNVGLPARENCGGCHFYGGGGDGVKHGDLDSSLIHPSYDLNQPTKKLCCSVGRHEALPLPAMLI